MHILTTPAGHCFELPAHTHFLLFRKLRPGGYPREGARSIAVFPILADVVEVKTGSWSTDHWSNDFIRLNGWLRTCFAQLITPLDIDGIGQIWEESNMSRIGSPATVEQETSYFWSRRGRL